MAQLSTSSTDDIQETTTTSTSTTTEIPPPPPPPPVPSRIAFGSCNSQNLQQPLWPIIESRQPVAFIWGGDAIYADHVTGLDLSQFPLPRPLLSCATPSRFASLYSQQLSHPGYRSLLSTNLTIFGTFDDHDYGCNNGDSTFVHRRAAATNFLDFIGKEGAITTAMGRRGRVKGDGVYGVKVFDFGRVGGEGGRVALTDEEAGIDPDSSFPPQKLSEKSVAVFVLDVRSNKTPWGKKGGAAASSKMANGDFLGEGQWRWLSAALRRSTASVNVIVSGLQMLSERYPDGNLSEEWSKYPTAVSRLYDTVLQEGVRSPILVSGDVHMAQLLRRDCRRGNDDGRGGRKRRERRRSLVEVTTSGMTHSWGTCFSPRLNHHTKWYSFYSYFVSRTIMEFLHWGCHWPDLMVTDEPAAKNKGGQEYEEGGRYNIDGATGGYNGAKTGKQYSLGLNFAEMEFDWEEREVILRVIGRDFDDDGTPLLSAKWSFDQLSGITSMPPNNDNDDDVRWRQHEKESLPFSYPNDTTILRREQLNDDDDGGGWTCLPYRGDYNQGRNMVAHAGAFTLLSGLVLFPWVIMFVVCYKILLLCSKRWRFKTPGLKTVWMKKCLGKAR